MTDTATRPRSSGPAVRLLVVTAAAVTVAVVGVLAVVGLAILHVVAPAGPPHHPENPSWRYGERIMQQRLYPSLTADDDVTKVCRSAMRDRAQAPDGFDYAQAVAGCRYGEWVIDN